VDANSSTEGVAAIRRPGGHWYLNMFSRMNPVAARTYRAIRRKMKVENLRLISVDTAPSGPKLDGPCDSASEKRYTDSEVAGALNATGAPLLAGVDPREVPEALNQRYQTLLHLQDQEKAFMAQNEQKKECIAEKKETLKKVKNCIKNLMYKHDEKDKWNDLRRRHQVYKSVAQHIEDVDDKIEAASASTYAIEAKGIALSSRIECLQERIQSECQNAGFESVEEICMKVEELPVLHFPLDGDNDDGEGSDDDCSNVFTED
jgi:hypothetical protein